MHLHELFGWPGPLTHRQFLAWIEHLEEPDTHDWYAMAVAAEVRRGNVKEPGKVQVSDLRLGFVKTRKITEAEETALAKAKWFAVSGYDPGDAGSQTDGRQCPVPEDADGGADRDGG
jgi:hypothetical protein